MSMDSERDTHFQHFAQLLWDELDEKGEFNIDMESKRSHEIVTEIIARRAYDFAFHLLMRTTPATGSTIKQFAGLSVPEILARIPVMADWPQIGDAEDRNTRPKRFRC